MRTTSAGWRGRVPVAAALLGVTALAVLAWLRPEEPGDRGITVAETVACADRIFTGRLVAVDADEPGEVDDGYAQLTFEVVEWLRPTAGDERVTVEVATEPGASSRLETGDALRLVLTPRQDDEAGFEARAQDVADRTEEVRRLLAEPDPPACPDDPG